MSENRVLFGLKNIHIAFVDKLITPNDSTMPGWEDPVSLEGAVQFSLSSSGSANNVYGDDGIWHTFTGNSQTGTLQIWVPDWSIRARMLGDYVDEDGKYVETNKTGEHFAILGERTGNQSNERFVFYYCTAANAEVTYDTTQETPAPVAFQFSITASMLYFPPINITAMTSSVNKNISPSVYNNFFGAVVMPKALPIGG